MEPLSLSQSQSMLGYLSEGGSSYSFGFNCCSRQPQNPFVPLDICTLHFSVSKDISIEIMASGTVQQRRKSIRSEPHSKKTDIRQRSGRGKRAMMHNEIREDSTMSKKSRIHNNRSNFVSMSRRGSGSPKIAIQVPAQHSDTTTEGDHADEQAQKDNKNLSGSSSHPVSHPMRGECSVLDRIQSKGNEKERNSLGESSRVASAQKARNSRLALEVVPLESNAAVPIHAREPEAAQKNQDSFENQELTASNASVSGMLKHLQHKFFNHLTGIENRISAKIQNLKEEQLITKREVEDLRAGRSLSSGARSNSTRRTSLSDWNDKLDALTPNADYVLDSDAIKKIACFNTPLTIARIAADSGPFLHNCAIALETIMFGKQPKQPRNVFHDGIGLRYCEFRQSVVLNLLINLQNNRLGTFKLATDHRTDPTEESNHTVRNPSLPQGVLCSGDRNSESRSSLGTESMPTSARTSIKLPRKMDHPRWLQKGFIRGDDVSEARAYLETVPESRSNQYRRIGASGEIYNLRKTVVKDTPSKRDIALHGAKKVFSVVTSFLHDAREKCKAMFAEDLGYVMVDWIAYKADVNQQSLKLCWAYPELSVTDYSDRQIQQTQRGANASMEADAYNADLMRKLIASRLEMIVLVEHQVLVSDGSSTRKRSGGELRRLTKAVNLIEVATRFLVEYCHCDGQLAYLRGHEDSLRSIVCVSFVFRAFVTDFMSAALNGGQYDGSIDTEELSAEDVTCHIARLSSYLPGYSVMKRIIDNKVLRMNNEMFTMLNLKSIDTSVSRPQHTNGNEETSDGAEIEPSLSAGVFLL